MLLGAHPAWATTAELLALTDGFQIREPTLRVALTRMVAAGDLVRSADGYRLSDRLLARQRRQDEALDPRTRAWDGSWLTLVVTTAGTAAPARAAFRKELQDLRFAELREGVWLRPDNLCLDLPGRVQDRVRVLRAYDDNPAELAGRLWDVSAWSSTGHRLLREMADAQDVPARFAVAAAMVRHLLTDPVLPADLLSADWPGARIRAAYREFVTEMRARRDSARPSGLIEVEGVRR